MIVIKLLHLILGFLDIEITGKFNERMLNLFAINKINVWNISKTEEKIYVSIKVKDFKKVRKIRRKTGIKVSVVRRHGLPFVFAQYHLRYGFFIGIALYFTILYLLSLFVWQINVVGNYNVDTDSILKVCEELGLKKGAFKKNINSHNLRDKLLLNCDSLAWASINIEGATVTVNVSEIKNSMSETSFCNIVSDYNGVIKNILVQKGTAAVKNGDAVQKGNLLISGVVEIAGQSHFTNATGIVTAEVEEQISITVSKRGIAKNYLNNGYSKFALDFFGIKLPLYLGGELREHDLEKKIFPLYLFGKEMPVTLYRLDVYPFQTYLFDKCGSEITAETDIMFKNELAKKGISDYKLINTENFVNDNENNTVFTVKYVKNIGFKEKLLF